MTLWIPVTVAAAIFQTLRFMLQKSLSAVTLSAAGATFARFLYSAPVILAAVLLYTATTNTALPNLTGLYWLYVGIGGLAQILATVCVVLLFKQRNFAVGITFKKTEVIQTALVGLVVLGDHVSLGGWLAILIGLGAVLILSKTPESQGAWWRHLTNRAALLGLGSGVLFAFSAVSYRGASLELGDGEAVLRAAVTLASVTTVQMIGMALWLWWRDRDQIRAVWASRRVSAWVGLTSMGGSFCWFLAFTLQNAAYVKALGQVELIFSLLASTLVFRETITAREMTGMAVLAISVLTLVLAA